MTAERSRALVCLTDARRRMSVHAGRPSCWSRAAKPIAAAMRLGAERQLKATPGLPPSGPQPRIEPIQHPTRDREECWLGYAPGASPAFKGSALERDRLTSQRLRP